MLVLDKIRLYIKHNFISIYVKHLHKANIKTYHKKLHRISFEGLKVLRLDQQQPKISDDAKRNKTWLLLIFFCVNIYLVCLFFLYPTSNKQINKVNKQTNSLGVLVFCFYLTLFI